MAIETRKAGLLRWESGVTIGRCTYYFLGFTKKASVKRAERFLKENAS